VLAHERRRILHFHVTAHPSAEWTAQKLRNASWDSAPRYLLRDRDRIFGDAFTRQARDMGIKQLLSAPRSPWQRAYVERVIGAIRRECLDHVIIFNEAALYPADQVVHSVLSRIPNASFASQGLTRVAPSAATGTRTNRGYPANGRSPSPLRPAHSVNRWRAVIVRGRSAPLRIVPSRLRSPIATVWRG
jgi:transposase InsO family protein